ncbi:indole-3-glycerol phosphate synthase-domain-containing protein [Catenaria anguillulae PL171]|uniref:Multifunctional tryptophan biosynthesis protein n=1 Tax=Catenaria anguillulae PL171 TaxID=765915 RepID=A0A1Y2HU22_9FUNG|nr:indole-3-glycerol phosphate synthase-domain-containing protein [Catenaria anguillulae PL171]
MAAATNGVSVTKPAPPVIKTFAPNQLPTLSSANDIYNLSTSPLSPTTPITLLIDNYDSFVFNVYQYLCAEGATVVVYRNDQITLEAIHALHRSGTLRNIVISPGPGHPADSGISPAVIRDFAGKVPILGVCLGEQAMFHVWGGRVTYAGSVVHGKTSAITHDAKGLYRGLPQGFHVTRYHSLAGEEATLPGCLEITSWTADGHVMGVRHKQFTVEGVQYHPESVMSAHGRDMVRNFLGLTGGTWADNDPSYLSGAQPLSRPESPAASGAQAQKETILEKIYRQRKLDVDTAMQLPGKSLAHLRALVAHGAAPAPIDIYARLTQAKHAPAVMAEVKRASPSKGMIDGTANAGLRALEYARAGASVISVLTEPTWFKGSLEDLKEVTGVLTTAMGADRPAVLRKDFVFCEYQLLEARAAGADAVLLIVAMLTDTDLARLLRLTRVLGMEALVEVNNADEMHRALAVGSRIIGVNNRNLHTFDVDMGTTSAVAGMVPEGVVLCALSGIAGRKDVEPYLTEGVHAVLVGEALMRAKDRAAFMRELWGVPEPTPVVSTAPEKSKTLVKICGLKTKEHALAAAKAGAHMLGFIFVPGTKRYIVPSHAREIVRAVRGITGNEPMPFAFAKTGSAAPRDLAALVAAAPVGRPLTVGVFQNASREEILTAVRESGVDLIQLHGDEDPDLATYLPLPVIKVFRPSDSPALIRSGAHVAALLDSAVGGSGLPFDWAMVPQLVGEPEEDDHVAFVLAGGLHLGNVVEAIRSTRPVGVDVSSGVEVDGVKSVELIERFIDENTAIK